MSSCILMCQDIAMLQNKPNSHQSCKSPIFACIFQKVTTCISAVTITVVDIYQELRYTKERSLKSLRTLPSYKWITHRYQKQRWKHLLIIYHSKFMGIERGLILNGRETQAFMVGDSLVILQIMILETDDWMIVDPVWSQGGSMPGCGFNWGQAIHRKIQ